MFENIMLFLGMLPILSREVRFHYPGDALFSQWIFIHKVTATTASQVSFC